LLSLLEKLAHQLSVFSLGLPFHAGFEVRFQFQISCLWLWYIYLPHSPLSLFLGRF